MLIEPVGEVISVSKLQSKKLEGQKSDFTAEGSPLPGMVDTAVPEMPTPPDKLKK